MIAEQFRNHEVWDTVTEVKECAESFSTTAPLDEEQREVISVQVPAMAGAVLYHKTNASGLYAKSLLDPMYQSWAQIQSYVDQLEQSPSQIGNLQSSLENVRTQLAKWPTYFALKGGAVPAALSQFNALAESQAKRIEFLGTQIESKDQELEDRDAAHAEDLEELRKQIQDLEALIDAREDELKRQEESIAALTTQHNETFAQSQDHRQGSWKTWLEEHDETYDSAVNEQLSKLRDAHVSGEEILEALRAQRDEVEKVSSKIGEGILAKGYNSYAIRDWCLGILFVFSGAVGVWIAVESLTQALSGIGPETDTSWQWTLLKVTVTFLITAGATVSFAFARQFFAQAADSKRTELELRVINPFLADLEDKELADSVKAQFVERSMGQNKSNAKDSAKESSNQDKLLTIVHKLTDLIGKD